MHGHGGIPSYSRVMSRCILLWSYNNYSYKFNIFSCHVISPCPYPCIVNKRKSNNTNISKGLFVSKFIVGKCLMFTSSGGG